MLFDGCIPYGDIMPANPKSLYSPFSLHFPQNRSKRAEVKNRRAAIFCIVFLTSGILLRKINRRTFSHSVSSAGQRSAFKIEKYLTVF